MFKFIMARLKEASTWRGMIAIITSLGVVTTPDQQGAIIATGLGVIGLVGTLVPDFKK